MRKLFYIGREAFRTLRRFRLRSTLTVGSTVLGVMGLLVSMNYTVAGRIKLVRQLRRMGTDVIIVTPRQSKNVAGRARTGSAVTTLRPADNQALRRDIPELIDSSEIASGSFLVKAGDLSKPLCPVVGCEPRYIQIKDWLVAQGRFFDAQDVRAFARVAVLGYGVAQDLFPDRSPLGQRVLVNRVPMEVVGVLSERGQGLDTSNEDAQIYVPVSTAMARLMNRTHLNAILFRVSSSNQIPATMEKVDAILKRRHRPRPKLPADYQIQNQQEALNALNTSSARLAFLVRSVGASGLLVSGLGVFALCSLAIRDRTPELGTRRALGAAATDIFLQILSEAAFVSIAGALSALALGYVVTRAAESKADLPMVFNWRQAAALLLYSLLLNQMFGLLAARRAARIDPVVALKYE